MCIGDVTPNRERSTSLFPEKMFKHFKIEGALAKVTTIVQSVNACLWSRTFEGGALMH